MPSSPHWKLRRFAIRAKRIQARRAAESGAVAAFASTLVPAADAYIAAYGAAAKSEAGWKREVAEGKGAISALVKALRSWLPRVGADIRGFDSSSFADRPEVPDDVIEDGERFVEIIDEHKDAAGNPLPYRQAALAELDPLLAAAQKEWSEADGADVAYQKLLADVRKAAAAFDPELQAFRRTLFGAFGRSDKDYQKLRADRASTPDDDDDEGSAGGSPPPQAP